MALLKILDEHVGTNDIHLKTSFQDPCPKDQNNTTKNDIKVKKSPLTAILPESENPPITENLLENAEIAAI